MKPYHLQVERLEDSGMLRLQWFGPSAIRPEGSRDLPTRPDAVALPPGVCLIELDPLLAEIAAGAIADVEAFKTADEFVQLKDLLAREDFDKLCETLFRFLWRESQRGLTKDGVTIRYARGKDAAAGDYDRRLVPVWFGTDRKPLDEENIGAGFSAFDWADAITYGVCHVFIPKSHKPGSTGSPWWRRWFVLQADDRLQLRDVQGLEQAAFWQAMAKNLHDQWRDGQRNVFVYLHGYNVSFEEAAQRAAQIGYDLKLPGEIALFSWPSHGATADYLGDEATITGSVPHIAQFLHELSERSGAERIHLFVHSMGNRGLLSALERIVALDLPNLRLGQVFFCAPDEDVRTFRDKVTAFPHQVENRTLLVSPEDRAVLCSERLHKHGRVGLVPPVVTYPGVETIEVGGFGLFDLGHDYYASAAKVMEDMREAIETKKLAKDRTIPKPFERHFMIDVSG